MRKIFLTFLFILVLTLFSCAKTEKTPPPADDGISETVLPETIQPVPDAPVTEKAEPVEVSFIACGDNITYGTKDARSKAVEGGRSLNFKPQYAQVAEKIASADIAFINQECVMAGEGYALSYYPRFNVPQELGYDLVELGYDVINIATNHMLDKGASGLASTIDFWDGLDVVTIGGYKDEEDFDNIRIIERKGIKFAFLSYTEHTNGLSKDSSSSIVIPYINDEDIIRQTALAHECADFVFVSIHWGEENSFTPSENQKRVAQLLADCEVDAIIGHHPHVLQPIEWLEGKNGNKTLCVYSLGNFVAEQDYDINMVGGILELTIKKEDSSRPYIDKVIFNPTVFHFSSDFYTNIVYYMEDYTEELANLHGVSRYYGHTLTFERLIGYAKNTISEEFLTETFKDVFKDY